MISLIKRKLIPFLAIILWIPITIFLIPGLISHGYDWYYGKNAVHLISGSLTGVPFLMSIVILSVFLWLFSPDGLRGYFEDDNGNGIKADFSIRRKIIIAVLTLIISAAGCIISMLWFERFTLEGIEKHHFFSHKTYEWNEVSEFRLKADSQGVLVMQFEMTDGKKYSFNGGILRAAEYTSNAFDEKFPEDVYDYMVWIGEELGNSGVVMDTSDWDKLKRKLKYDSWKTIAEDVKEGYMQAFINTNGE